MVKFLIKNTSIENAGEWWFIQVLYYQKGAKFFTMAYIALALVSRDNSWKDVTWSTMLRVNAQPSSKQLTCLQSVSIKIIIIIECPASLFKGSSCIFAEENACLLKESGTWKQCNSFPGKQKAKLKHCNWRFLLLSSTTRVPKMGQSINRVININKNQWFFKKVIWINTTQAAGLQLWTWSLAQQMSLC